MKKLLLLVLSFLLVSCTGTPHPDEEVIPGGDTDEGEEGGGEVIPPEVTNPLPEGNLILDKYTKHSYSEPFINEQLNTLNPLGNLKEVHKYYRGDKVIVAVIDSGFDIDHPEFYYEDGTSKISENSSYIYTQNHTKTTIEVGKDFVKIGEDQDSHGTMCAGLLGASVNSQGMLGIAPNVELLLIRIDKHVLSMAEAFKYAADHGAKVISTSLGVYPNNNGQSSGDLHFPANFDLKGALQPNIDYAFNKGVTIVAATGNDLSTKVSYPAGCDNVIGAGGLDNGSATNIWTSSSWGGSNYNGNEKYVDVFAPSEGIIAPGYDYSKNQHTYWTNAEGTSFASPIIAGAIALYFEKYPTKTNTDVINALQSSCRDISKENSGKDMGFGALDIGRLLHIDEDKKNLSIDGCDLANIEASKITIIDEAGWDFRTLHIYDVDFEEGYSYSELELFFDVYYGNRILTNNYELEGATRGWAYTDEGYIGDYFICLGNTNHAIETSYEYYFPSFVKGLTYQIVNNSNWLPFEGLRIDANNGYLKNMNTYFWYHSDYDTGLSQVLMEDKPLCEVPHFNYKLIYVKENVVEKETISSLPVFQYLEALDNWYIDNKLQVKYHRSILCKDAILFVKQ